MDDTVHPTTGEILAPPPSPPRADVGRSSVAAGILAEFWPDGWDTFEVWLHGVARRYYMEASDVDGILANTAKQAEYRALYELWLGAYSPRHAPEAQVSFHSAFATVRSRMQSWSDARNSLEEGSHV